MGGGGFRAEAADSVKYIDTDGTEKTADATAITSSTTSLSEGWYYVKDDVTLSSAISFSGTVNLILNDGKTLTVHQKFSDGTSLVIYGQSAGTGTLQIEGSSSAAMIQCTNVTINGGTVDVTSTYEGTSQASIVGSVGVTINGGTVNVTRNNTESTAKACIESSNGNVTINGGTVNVKGTGTRAYIGANVTINGGTVNVENTNSKAAYIGGSGSVTINGGQVTVTGTDSGSYKAGITCGSSKSITLGYTTYASDFIQAPGYYKNGTAANPTIETGKALVIDNTTFISTVNGTFKAVDANGNDVSNPDLNGKKLTPALAVTFNANGGTGDSYTQNGLNNDIKNLTANTFTRTGYTFEKWNTESDDSGTSYTDGQQVTLTDNFTLYAQWNLNTYIITYELNDGTNDSANPTSYTVESDTITLKAPTKEGYDFAGWTLDGQTITEIAKGSTGDKTLTATWTPTAYSIKYNLDGGSATNPTTYTIKTESFTLTNPVKDGYTFTGWTGTDLTTATQTVTIKQGSTGDREYTANYSENQQEQESQITLSALEVQVTGAVTLTVTEGEAKTSAYTASVTGKYSDGTSNTLTASDYSLEWTLDKNISGIQISSNGTLSVNNSVSAGKYSLTITATATQDNITGSGTRSVNVTVSQKESVVLEALNVSISGSEALTVKEGEALSSTYTANVTGTYSDGSSKALTAKDYSLKWTLDKNIAGISINNNGTLHINKNVKAGEYTLKITAQAKHGNITGSGTKSVNLRVGQQSNTLEALKVSITGSDSPYTTEGEAMTETYTASVNASYSDGTSKSLEAGDYSLEWTLDKSISGVSINNNGTLNVSSSAARGKYAITITAKATQDNITGSGVKNITLNVYKRSETTDASNLDSMSKEEKEAIEDLALTDNDSSKITDLKDIDLTGFTNLKTLDLSELKELETADLSQLPENVKEVNLQNTNITSLTLNSTVEKVNAKGCSYLEEINAEGSESLTELNVSDTNITSLNVKDCANLQKLECESCDIDSESLTLDGCESLNYLDIRDNHFSWFNYRADVLQALSEFLCSGQRVTGWYGKKTFDFAQFFSTGDIRTADNETSDAPDIKKVALITAYDESGNELTPEYDPESGLATFNGTPVVMRYYYETEFNNQSMDVTIIAYDSEEAADYLANSGGCSMGLSFSSFLFALSVLIFAKRR